MKNKLYYGDNLDILRDHIKDESVDLVYIDPPFNSNRNYNQNMPEATAQVTAFEDTWSLKSYNKIMEMIRNPEEQRYSVIHKVIDALEGLIGFSAPGLFGYLVYMAPRLVELFRVLKPTGSFYLHCDDNANHYLKLLLDQVFGRNNFRNEIVWRRTNTHSDAKNRYPRITDHILFYSKSNDFVFIPQSKPYDIEYIRSFYRYLEFPDGSVRGMTQEEIETQQIPPGSRQYMSGDLTNTRMGGYMYDYKGYKPPKHGWRMPLTTMIEWDEQRLLIFPESKEGRIRKKRILDKDKGTLINDIWTDITPLQGASKEKLGYPTQKPLELLERIIKTSSNEGDIVLDAYCGCGTTLDAAQKLNRKWIGIDITCLAINQIEKRLNERYYDGDLKRFRSECDIFGDPEDMEGFEALCTRTFGDKSRKESEIWVVTRLGGFYNPKKGADDGFDGYFYYVGEETHRNKYSHKGLISVKTGDKTGVDALRSFNSVLEKQKCEVGIFVSKSKPTKPMLEYIHTLPSFIDKFGVKYNRIILWTVEQLINREIPDLPIIGVYTIQTAHKKSEAFKGASIDNQLKLI